MQVTYSIHTASVAILMNTYPSQKEIIQAMSPRDAFLMPSHTVLPQEAIGQISAECLAPCPPGWTVLVPGQLITEELLNFKDIKSVRIIKKDSNFTKA